MGYLASEGVPELVQLGKSNCSTYEDVVEEGKVVCQARYFRQQGLQLVQDFDVLGLKGLFFFRTLLRVSRQGVNGFICHALTIIDLKMVIREFWSLTNLSKAQTFRVYESIEVVVVGKYKDFILRPF